MRFTTFLVDLAIISVVPVFELAVRAVSVAYCEGDPDASEVIPRGDPAPSPLFYWGDPGGRYRPIDNTPSHPQIRVLSWCSLSVEKRNLSGMPEG